MFSLFSGTIWENISYGRPEASAEEIRVAAERANAHRFIERFPAGYQQVIGERGLRLSGGQRQRIAVARAILKDAPILVLDEATSALDTKAERQVQAGLDELMRDRTSLIIAHRLSTIAGVDRIITLAEGRSDGVRSPAELAASGGIYAPVLDLQTSGATSKLARYHITGRAHRARDRRPPGQSRTQSTHDTVERRRRGVPEVLRDPVRRHHRHPARGYRAVLR